MKTRWRSWMATAMLLALPATVSSQVSLGTLLGQAQDDTGGVLPGVSVTATNTGTGLTRAVTTDSRGQYAIVGLQPGTYEVRAELAGFRTSVASGVVIQVNQETRLDFAMPLGELAETITVSAETTVVQTRTSTVGKVVDQTAIVAMPLNGRNFVDLGLLVPGVTTREQRTQAGSTYYVHGQRDDANNFLMDGVSSNELNGNTADIKPNPDAVQEFKIQTSNFSAEFGRNAGSIVQVVTKSGSNDISGAGWLFLRDDAFQSKDFFAINEPPPLSQKQYGATFGGPIIRNKTFVFGSYEGYRLTRGLTNQTIVATAGERAGDFSFLTKPILDPTTGQPFPGNVIPPNRIDPAATALLELMPLPNISGAGARANNYVSSPESTNNYDQFIARLDHNFNDNWAVFYRHFYQKTEQFNPVQGAGVSRYDGFPNTLEQTVGHYTVGLNTILSAERFNELRGGVYTRDQASSNLPFENPLDYGVGYDRPQDVIGGIGLPEFNITGMSGIGNQIQGPSTNDNYELQVTDVFTWDTGDHFLKFGAEVRKGREKNDVGFFYVGRFVFDGRYTGDSFADFLLGQAREFNFAGGRTLMDQNNWNMGLFFQDDFTVSDRLVLNLGLRWDFYSPIIHKTGETSTFFEIEAPTPNVPLSGIGQIVLAGDPAFDLPDRGTYFPDYDNIQPRVGVSWDIRGDGTLAIRGGAGVFHNQLKNNTTLQQLLSYPFYYQPVIRNTTLADPLLGLEREDYAVAPLNPGPGYDGQPIGQLYVTDPNIITPYTTAWSLSLQWEVLKSTILETAYVGNRGRKLLQFEEINQPYNQLDGITQSNKDLYRRYPGFTSVLQTTNWGRSSYNGWETSLFRRFSEGLSFGVAYTLSKSMDLSSHFHSGATNRTWVMTPQNADDPEAEWAPSFFDARHRLVVNETWQIPVGPDKKYLNEGALAHILGDWVVTSIWTYQSGRPFSPYDSADPCLTAGNWTPVCRPNLVGDPNAGPQTAQQWFNTAAFQRTGPSEFGTSPRNPIIGPDLFNVDFSFSKLIRLPGERTRLEIRAEVYNLFNTVNLGLPVVDIASSGFGRIGSQAVPAREWQFGIKVFY